VHVGEEVVYYDTASVEWAEITAPTSSGNRIVKAEAQAIFRYLQVEEKGIPDGATRHVMVFSTGRINTIDFSNNVSVGVKEIGDAFSGLSDLVCLRLHKESLRGRIPTYLFTLSTLEVLDLSENGLEGNIEKDIGQLKNLEVLNLSRNRFAGPLPSTLAGLSRLETLVLNHNHFSSFPDLSRCHNLTFVDVKKNPELKTADLREMLPSGAELFV
jgi:Leucine-rich repeat (LRR) protein